VPEFGIYKMEKVAARASSPLPKDGREELAKVLTGALVNSTDKFPSDLDRIWRFLGYSTKGNALQKLKRCFEEEDDYVHRRGQRQLGLTSEDRGGRPFENYFLSSATFEAYCMTSPSERGKIVRRFFISLNWEYFRTLEGLGKRRRQEEIMDESNAFLAKEQEKLPKDIRMTSSSKEWEVRKKLQDDIGGVTEVSCKYGRVDLLTEHELVEVKGVVHWKHALGQVLVYRECFPMHKSRIHLYIEGHEAVDITSICKI
jgi:hypothetical protein